MIYLAMYREYSKEHENAMRETGVHAMSFNNKLTGISTLMHPGFFAGYHLDRSDELEALGNFNEKGSLFVTDLNKDSIDKMYELEIEKVKTALDGFMIFNSNAEMAAALVNDTIWTSNSPDNEYLADFKYQLGREFDRAGKLDGLIPVDKEGFAVL